MSLQSFVDYIGPRVTALWLNLVDLFLNSRLDGTDTGVVNAYVVTTTGSFTRSLGARVTFIPGTVNTQAATLNAGGTGVATIVNWLGSALTGGEIIGQTTVRWDGTNWRLMSSACPVGNQKTAAETSAGVTVVNSRYPELYLYRYGTNDTPGTTNLTSAITAALSVAAQKTGGGMVEMPLDAVGYDGTISFSQGTGLRSAGSAYIGCKLIPLSSSAKFILDTQCELKNLWLYDAATRSGGVGIQIGRAGNFEAFSNLKNIKIEGFEQNLLCDNAYFYDLENVEVKGGTYGVTLNPTSGSGLGFITTISARKLYVHDCTGQGIRDLNTIQPQQLSWRDIVVEHCCPEQTAVAQIELGPMSAGVLDGVFVETQSSVTVKPTAIKARTGTFRNLYIDACYDAIDFGSTSCDAEVENLHTANVGRYSINATSGANGGLAMIKCYFATAPNLSINRWTIDRCTGTMPSGVDSGSTEMGGTTPRFGIGALTSSKIRAIKYATYTENITATANTTTEGTAVNIGSGWVASTSNGWTAFASAKSAPPTGVIMGGVHRFDNDNVKVRWANVTGTNQSVTVDVAVTFIRYNA